MIQTIQRELGVATLIFLKLLFVSRALEAGKILDKKRYVAGN